ncbi:hypothetical protein K432DRAFT_425805 [Lepidopterella palustris CBS 459.81]|uniref:Nuclear RNA binding protein n=1 Tax=Lepidopterella palustris CBS 459.81 TaxID=1314670 RepID=A0A8E2EAD3_9PEZI|nr:hypothetical protein K432DRAFT_425805 [Lepidopterella palustris CBS 459.81]
MPSLASSDATPLHTSHVNPFAASRTDLENSRKRGYDTQEEQCDELQGDGAAETSTPSLKRRRSSNWPLPAEEPIARPEQHAHRRFVSPSSSINKRHVSNGLRPSKFLEGSMNDRASQKPPSVFTRLFQGSTHDLSVDHLMEDYMETSNMPSTVKAHEKRSMSPSKTPSHHPNPAVSSIATGESKQSGIFRFGRSIASSFNPVNIWQKMSNTWKENKEELIREAMQVDERKARAEQAYAQLKESGKLPAPKVFYRDHVKQTSTEASHRDSAIQMDDPRPSSDHVQVAEDNTNPIPSASSASGASETRKSSFRFRTPSLSNLKKAKSHTQLHVPQTPTNAIFLSPDREQAEMERTIRKSQSKKDMLKQQKLNKRVSDLEAKLEEARRELTRALGAPPVPVLPTSLADVKTSNVPPRSVSPQKRQFVPGALPSLPSERLLFPQQLEVEEDAEEKAKVEPEKVNPEKEKPLQPLEDDVATMGPVEITLQHDDAMTKGDIWTDDIDTLAKPKATAPRRKVAKKRKSGDKEDLRYKPQSEDDDDAEWESAKAAKKRRSAARAAEKTSPKSKKQNTANRLTKKQQQTAVEEPAKDASAKDPETITAFASGSTTNLATVHEEHTTKIPLSDEPSRPTAFATPSHPSKRHQHRSPSANKLSKRRDHSRCRSSSPPPNYLSRDEGADENDVVSVVPDGVSIPPIPPIAHGNRGKKNGAVDDGWDGLGDEIF